MRITAVLLLACLVQPLGGCLAAGGRISNVVGIDTAEGVNSVQRFSPDGRQGVIVVARRQAPTGTADPGTAVTVLLPRFSPSRGWDLVPVEDASGRVADGPGTPAVGRRQAVRFARAKVGGIPATLMFVATAERGGGATEISTYRLRTDGEDGSGLAAVFGALRTVTVPGNWCSPEAALEAVERLDPAPGGSCAGT